MDNMIAVLMMVMAAIVINPFLSGADVKKPATAKSAPADGDDDEGQTDDDTIILEEDEDSDETE